MTSIVYSSATTRRWRRPEYERLVELGIFVGERLELLDGALVVLRDPRPTVDTMHGWAYRSVDVLRPPAALSPLARPALASPSPICCPDAAVSRVAFPASAVSLTGGDLASGPAPPAQAVN